MKKILKSSHEPPLLKKFRHNHPKAHWDKSFDGQPQVDQSTAQAVLTQCLEDQKGLCAYCELHLIPDGWPDHELRFLQRVEHYLAKSEKRTDINIHLHWPNLLAVCTGGTQTALVKKNAPYLLKPIDKNESCDAHKNSLIQKLRNAPAGSKKIDEDCTGYILNPLNISPLINLFDIEKYSGKLIPHTKRCLKVTFTPNYLSSTEALVQNTIDVLNLNCDRLMQQRLKVIQGFNRNLKTYMQSGKPAHDLSRKLAKFYFEKQWPEFFTSIRCLIGSAAEDYLRETHYQG